MNEQDYGRVIAKNIKRLAYEKNKTQADIARDLNLSKTTLSSWMSGYRVPRMSKIDMLAKYFGVTRSELTEPYGMVAIGTLSAFEKKRTLYSRTETRHRIEKILSCFY